MSLFRCSRPYVPVSGEIVLTIDGVPIGLPPLRPGEVRHSPTGFELGYGGSGPSELARAILIACFPGNEAVRDSICYDAFKWDIIVPADRNGLELTTEQVEAWYAAWAQTEAGARLLAQIELRRQIAQEPAEPD
jgi:hypothetical protein